MIVIPLLTMDRFLVQDHKLRRLERGAPTRPHLPQGNEQGPEAAIPPDLVDLDLAPPSFLFMTSLSCGASVLGGSRKRGAPEVEGVLRMSSFVELFGTKTWHKG